MSTRDLLSDIKRELCEVCSGDYENPKILPCLHTFCHKCISSISDYDGEHITCSICEESCLIDGRYGQGYPDHLLVAHLSSINSAKRTLKESTDLFCQICNLSPISKATTYCIECRKFMCDFDASAHKKWVTKFPHQFLSNERVETDNLFHLLPECPKINCSKHDDEEAKSYCPDCDSFACENCAKISHSNHSRIQLKDFKLTYGDRLAVQTKKILDRSLEVDNTIKEYQNKMNQFEAQNQELIQRINKDFSRIIESVNNRRVSLIYEATNFHAKRMKLLDYAIQKQKLIKQKMIECVNFYEDYNNRCPEQYLIPFTSSLMNRIEDLDFNNPTVSLDITSSDYSLDKLDELLQQIQNLGALNIIHEPKISPPIAKVPASIFKRKWGSGVVDDKSSVSMKCAAMNNDNLLQVIFKENKTSQNQVLASDESETLKIHYLDPYCTYRKLCKPVDLNIRSATQMQCMQSGYTYIVDRVSKKVIALDRQFNQIHVAFNEAEDKENKTAKTPYLEDPTCLAIDGPKIFVFNYYTSKIDVFDTSLSYISTIVIPSISNMKYNRSLSSENSKDSLDVTPMPRTRSRRLSKLPSVNLDVVTSVNFAINSKSQICYVPSDKHVIVVMDDEGNFQKNVDFTQNITQPLFKSISLENEKTQQKDTSGTQTLDRSKRRSLSNRDVKKSEIYANNEKKVSTVTFVIVNEFDNLYIYQNNNLLIFNVNFEIMYRKNIPPDIKPKGMYVDIYGHIYLISSDENLLIC